MCSECKCVLLSSGTAVGYRTGHYVLDAAGRTAAGTARKQLDSLVAGRFFFRRNSKWVRCSGLHSHVGFDVSFTSRYKSSVWYLGRRLKSATAPQLYSLRTELDYATGQRSGKAAQVRRSVSQETGQALTQGVFDFDGRVGERSDDLSSTRV